MIEADDAESARAGVPPRVDVRYWIHEKVVDGVAGQVHARHRLHDFAPGADEQTTAFGRRRRAGVGGNRIQRGPGDPQRYNDSTIMAMPMPPPIQSDAAPYCKLRRRSAWTSVVSTRAPLAPIG